MKKGRLFEMMERINPDMKVSYDNMVDLMMDDIEYVKKYQDRINELNADDTFDILRYNPQSYELLKDHAREVLKGDHIAQFKAYTPEIAEKFSDLNYLIDPTDIANVINISPDKLTAFSDILNDDQWLKNNYKGLNMIWQKYPELRGHRIFNRARVLQQKGSILFDK